MLIRLYITLFLFSIALLTWQHLGMDSYLRLDHNSNAQAISDRNVANDSPLASQADVSIEQQAKKLTCQIKFFIDYPFCELSFNLVNPFEIPLDLSNYTKIKVKLAYIPPKAQKSFNLRFQIRNYEPNISNSDDLNTFRLNEAKLNIKTLNHVEEYTITFDDFYIPEWWSSMMILEHGNAQTNFERAVFIKIMTPENVVSGEHTIFIEYITLEGKLISQASLLKLLTITWLLAIIGHVFFIINSSRVKAQRLIKKQQELEKMNTALAIETKELQGLVTRDHLTGIRNRHGIRDLLLELVLKTEDNSFKLSAMYLDLDKFKVINDTYGHDVGDKVLVIFSQLISENIRSNDIFARWGGEEFLLICPDLDCLQAHLLAEKLRMLIMEQTWPTGTKVTCSIGVTEYKPREDIAELLKRADNALYQSKARGRNRTTML
ncbi:GGDEF domain-containing protein [Thalassotalea agariperforans]